MIIINTPDGIHNNYGISVMSNCTSVVKGFLDELLGAGYTSFHLDIPFWQVSGCKHDYSGLESEVNFNSKWEYFEWSCDYDREFHDGLLDYAIYLSEKLHTGIMIK